MLLKPTTLGTLSLFLHTRNLFLVSRFTRLSTRLMVQCRGTRIDWLFEVTKGRH